MGYRLTYSSDGWGYWIELCGIRQGSWVGNFDSKAEAIKAAEQDVVEFDS